MGLMNELCADEFAEKVSTELISSMATKPFIKIKESQLKDYKDYNITQDWIDNYDRNKEKIDELGLIKKDTDAEK